MLTLPADPALATHLARLVGAAPPRAGGRRVLALEGRSGSGKSHVAALLADRLGWPVIHMDDLYPGWDGLDAGVALARAWVIAPLLRGAEPRWRRYDWSAGEFREWHHTPVRDTLVVEGCGSGARELRPHLSLLAWIEAPAPVRAARLDLRDDAVAYAPHRRAWAEREFRFHTRNGLPAAADLRIDNPDPAP
ncbi:hypothetical protein ACQEU5_17735 [Marinactinospora thermotolerans]|uniref:Cytidylate kinase n=1 Tax=Marinactinospora thermotolerans DSM 45154 TaxID=1122192 RepID=A0A1T4S6A3_9ACTN|nr:hypothetical protein [Marinactinospora thermotolerans]SKA23784.1 Cytidylate kinase [Marinactinospora thermotolerans DSM 45154]